MPTPEIQRATAGGARGLLAIVPPRHKVGGAENDPRRSADLEEHGNHRNRASLGNLTGDIDRGSEAGERQPNTANVKALRRSSCACGRHPPWKGGSRRCQPNSGRASKAARRSGCASSRCVRGVPRDRSHIVRRHGSPRRSLDSLLAVALRCAEDHAACRPGRAVARGACGSGARGARARALLYVGFTRARDHLIVAARIRKEAPTVAWLDELCNTKGQPLIHFPDVAGVEGDGASLVILGLDGRTMSVPVLRRVLDVGTEPPVGIRGDESQVAGPAGRTSTQTTRHVARIESGSRWSGGRVNAVLDGSFAQGGGDLRR